MNKDTDLQAAWDAFKGPENMTMFYAEPKRLQNAKNFKQTLQGYEHAGFVTREGALASWDAFIERQLKSSFQAAVQDVERFQRVVNSFPLTESYVDANDLEDAVMAAHRRSAVVSLQQKAALNGWDDETVFAAWRNSLEEKGRLFQAKETRSFQHNDIDSAAPVFD